MPDGIYNAENRLLNKKREIVSYPGCPYPQPKDYKCSHVYEHKLSGRCYHVYTCKKCGNKLHYDTSD